MNGAFLCHLCFIAKQMDVSFHFGKWFRVTRCKIYLCSYPVNSISGVIEGLEKVISPPLDDVFNVAELSGSFIFCTVFNHTPTQHGHGKRCREVKLDCIPSIIIASHQVFNYGWRVGLAIIQTRVSPPANIIMPRKFSSCNYWCQQNASIRVEEWDWMYMNNNQPAISLKRKGLPSDSFSLLSST